MNKVVSSYIWKLLERGGYVGIQFVVQIVLARLIDPAYFGVLTIMTAFTSLVQVFTQNGLNMALVQNQEVTEDDYSTVFFANLGVMSFFYVLFFAFAPLIEHFYNFTDFTAPFRVLALIFFALAFSSVQVAKLTKELRFKTIFKCSLIGVIVSGIVGIIMAYRGFGLWALVTQALLNQILNMLSLFFSVEWRPRRVFSAKRLKMLFSFGGKMMAGSLIGAVYNDVCSFIIGKMTSAADLAFFKRGKLFPQTGANVVTATTQSVMLPMLAARQNNQTEMLRMLRKTMRLSTYLVTPLMLGLLAVARPMTIVLLTEKWLPSVPYLQVFCLVYVIYQIHGIYTQALNAKGYSDLTLIVQIVMISGTLVCCVLAMAVFHSTLLVAWGTLLVAVVITIPLDIYYCKTRLGYDLKMQSADTLPSLLLSLLMLCAVSAVQRLPVVPLVMLLIQIATGIIVYATLSAMTKNENFRILSGQIKRILGKRERK